MLATANVSYVNEIGTRLGTHFSAEFDVCLHFFVRCSQFCGRRRRGGGPAVAAAEAVAAEAPAAAAAAAKIVIIRTKKRDLW